MRQTVYMYPSGYWGLTQAAKLFALVITVQAVDVLLRGSGDFRAAIMGAPGAFFLAQWCIQFVHWSLCLGGRIRSVIRWLVTRL
jgi:hypothetical protein